MDRRASEYHRPWSMTFRLHGPGYQVTVRVKDREGNPVETAMHTYSQADFASREEWEEFARKVAAWDAADLGVPLDRRTEEKPCPPTP